MRQEALGWESEGSIFAKVRLELAKLGGKPHVPWLRSGNSLKINVGPKQRPAGLPLPLYCVFRGMGLLLRILQSRSYYMARIANECPIKKSLLGEIMKKFCMALLLLLCCALSAQAAEAPKDYIFKALPNLEITGQQRNFNQLKVKTPQPDNTELLETTHEGNLVATTYRYAGPGDSVPSPLQINRHYQNSAKKLEGKVLYADEWETHASFIRNGKQYYMTVQVHGLGADTTVSILEVAAMQDDTEIIDSDTILYKLEKEGHIALYINFDTGKATLKPDAAEVIAEIVTALKSKPQLKVKLEGHTDNVGNADANQKLSDDRAKAVMAGIVARGIDKARLSAEGFGLEKPIADNNTEEGRAKNRRVVLVKQ